MSCLGFSLVDIVVGYSHRSRRKIVEQLAETGVCLLNISLHIAGWQDVAHLPPPRTNATYPHAPAASANASTAQNAASM
jgi:hypothetical protein